MWKERWEQSVKDITFNIILSQDYKNRPICPVQIFPINFLSLNLLRTKCLFKTLGKVQVGFVLEELIPNKGGIKILRFAGQIHNSRKWYVSPIQSTYKANFRLRA